MRYVYAALLLHASGQKIGEENINNVLKASGGDIDPVRVKALVASLAEVDIDEALKTAPGVVVAPTPSEPTPKKEEKKTEEEEEKKEEAIAGLGALFG